MHVAKSILLILSGATAGIAFVISCGDNWHLGADAAVDAAVDAPKSPDAAPVCDCPAAEPPLANRLVVQDVLQPLDPNQAGSINIFCPPGARPISGSCTVVDPIPDKDVILRESGFIYDAAMDKAWRCSFRNNEPTRILYRVAVLCLKPAP